MEFKTINVSQITESATNPRTNFDEALVKEISDSIRSKGLISPVLVRPRKKDKFELVCGARRLRACKIAGMTEIPCIVRDLSDEEAFEIQIIENLQRSDVHPLDEADAFSKLVAHGYTIEQIGQKIGKGKTYIGIRIKLNDLLPEYKKMFYDGDILLAHAAELCRISAEDQKRCATVIKKKENYNDNGNWKEREVIISPAGLKSHIHGSVILSLKKAPFKITDPDLYKKAGACNVCPKRSGCNKDLFNDIQEDDRCFDGACYRKKTELLIANKVAAFKGESTEFKYIADNWQVPDELKKQYPGALDMYNFKKVEKKQPCEHSIKGIHLMGNETGHVIDICAEKKCKVHYFQGSSFSSSRAETPKEIFRKRWTRNRELDEEKIHKQLVDNLAEVPVYKEVCAINLLQQEHDVMIKLILESVGFGLKSFGFKKDAHSITLEDISKMPDAEKNFLIRRAIFDKYKNDVSDEMKWILGAFKIQVNEEQVKADQLARREKREATALKNFEKEHGFNPFEEKPKAAVKSEKKTKKQKLQEA